MKAKGDRFEIALRDYLRNHGFPWTERTRAGYARDHGDLHLSPGLIVQAKNRARLCWSEWFTQLAQQRADAGAAHAVLVVRRPGIARPEDALAVMRVADMARLLRDAGYGEPLHDDQTAAGVVVDVDREGPEPLAHATDYRADGRPPCSHDSPTAATYERPLP